MRDAGHQCGVAAGLGKEVIDVGGRVVHAMAHVDHALVQQDAIAYGRVMRVTDEFHGDFWGIKIEVYWGWMPRSVTIFRMARCCDAKNSRAAAGESAR